MTFIEHIQEIDKRIKVKKEAEYRATMFGAESQLIDGKGAVSVQRNYGGGVDIIENGIRKGSIQPSVIQGRVNVTDRTGINRIGSFHSDGFGGYTYNNF